MAFDAYFFNFQKKENSTKAPTQAQWESGADLLITLLDTTSIIEPRFVLEMSTPPMAAATKYNYCYVPDFHRFYFIENWETRRNLWICTCKCDVLASYRTAILTSSQYVLRSASSYDLRIIDTIYPTKTQPTYQEDETQNAIYNLANGANECVATIQTLGSLADSDASWYPQKTAAGGFLYAISMSQLRTILDYMIEDFTTWAQPAADISYEACKMIFDPFEYIKSIRIYPLTQIFTPSQQQGMSPIKFGFWQMPAYGYRVSNGLYQFNFYIALHAHPQAATRGNKMNGAPYTQRVLHFEPFGDISLDCANLVDAMGIVFDCRLDLSTGQCKYMLKPVILAEQMTYSNNPNSVIASGYAQLGYELPLTQMRPNVSIGDIIPSAARVGLGFGNQLGNAIMDAGIGGGLSGYGAARANDKVQTSIVGIGDALQAATTQMNTKGGGGSMLPCYYLKPFVSSFFYEQVEENIIDHGRPLCQMRTLQNLSGYCLCENAELTIDGLAAEQAQIISMLNTGVFIE